VQQQRLDLMWVFQRRSTGINFIKRRVMLSLYQSPIEQTFSKIKHGSAWRNQGLSIPSIMPSQTSSALSLHKNAAMTSETQAMTIVKPDAA